MRQRMVRIRDSDVLVGSHATLAADDERDHPRQVRLKRQDLKVEHEFGVFNKLRRNPRGLINWGRDPAVVAFSPLNTISTRGPW